MLQIWDHFFLNLDKSLENPRLCPREETRWLTGIFYLENGWLFISLGTLFFLLLWTENVKFWITVKRRKILHSYSQLDTCSFCRYMVYTVYILYCAYTFRDSLRNTYSVLKGTVSWDRFQKFSQKFTEPGLTKGRTWFLNFFRGSNDFIIQNVYLLRLMPVCVGLILVSCLFLSVPLITSGV